MKKNQGPELNGKLKKKRYNKTSFGQQDPKHTPNNAIRIPSSAGQHKNRKTNQTIQQILFTGKKQRQLTRIIFWAKQTVTQTSEDQSEKLIELGKECDFPEISSKLLLS